jgi:uncharacterized membrane protein YccC
VRVLLDATTPAGAALRTTLAAALAMALALALHVEVPSLAVVFVLARGSAGAVTMLAGAVAGAASGLVLLDLADQSRIGLSLALFVLTALATYLALGRRFPYAFIQLQLNLLVLVGQALDTPDEAVRYAFYDVANVAIAAFAAFVAGASQPVAIPSQLQRALAVLVASAGVLLAPTRAPGTDVAVRLELLTRRARSLLAQAWPTRQVSRARLRVLSAAVAASEDLHRRLLALSALASSPGEGASEAATAALREGLARAAALLEPGRERSLERAARRDAARTVALAARRAEAAAGERAPLAAAVVAGAAACLTRLALATPLLPPGATSRGEAAALAAPRAREREPVDRFRLRHAVKTAAAYELVLWAWVAAHWGAIVPAFVVSVLVATLATPLGATLTKAALRVGGVLAGGVAGLAVAVVLLPWVTTLWSICAVLAVPLFAFLWLQQRSERLAFAALQSAIAFSLTLVHGPAPAPTWRAPLESLIGLAFGICVVVAVMHAVWPIDAASSAHRALATLLARGGRRLGAVVSLRDPGDERAAPRADREHAAGFAHEVALYGGQFGRPAEHLAVLVRLVCELDALAAVLATEAPPPRADLPAETRRELVRTGDALAAACTALARDLVALPGEADDLAAAHALRELAARCASLRSGPRDVDDAGASLRAAAATTSLALLDEIHAQLARPEHTRGVPRRAA